MTQYATIYQTNGSATVIALPDEDTYRSLVEWATEHAGKPYGENLSLDVSPEVSRVISATHVFAVEFSAEPPELENGE